MKKEDKWQAAFLGASDKVSQWRKNHSKVTFSEIENDVDEELARVRTAMFQDGMNIE